MKNIDINKVKQDLKAMDVKKVYANKIQLMQNDMQEKGLDGIVCLKPENIFNFTQFNSIYADKVNALIVPVEGNPVLLTHALRMKKAEEVSTIDDVRTFGLWGDRVSIADGPYEAIEKTLKAFNLKGKKIGFEKDYLALESYEKIADICGKENLVDATSILLDARVIKNDYEICKVKLAAYLSNIGIEAMIKSGRKSEIGSSLDGEQAMMKAWERDLGEFRTASFGSKEGQVINGLLAYTLTGYRLTYAADSPSGRIPQPGEISLPIVYGTMDGFIVENERSLIIDRLEDKYMHAYETVGRAQKKALSVIKPGVPINTIYNVATDIFVEAGYGHLKSSRIGHGMGLGIHDYPDISKGEDRLLEKGMVFTVEPGLFFDGWGAIRHSDTVVVTDDGVEVVTVSPEKDPYNIVV